jgi:drug/metabolite transporter (DMT)-like permease
MQAVPFPPAINILQRAMPAYNNPSNPTLMLKGAAAVFALMGLGIVVWLADKAARHPEIRASQLGSEAPLWLPMIVFVLACTGAAVFLFLQAAKRTRAGEDLFENRHRKSRHRAM